MDIIDLMIEYRKDGSADQLAGAEICKDNLNGIIVNILSWLKLEYKRSLWLAQGKKTKLKPLELNEDYSWCIDLKKMIQNTKVFSKYFAADGNKVVFAKEIPIEEQNRLREKAYYSFNPQMHT